MSNLQWVARDPKKRRQRLIMAELIARPGRGPLSRLRLKPWRGAKSDGSPRKVSSVQPSEQGGDGVSGG